MRRLSRALGLGVGWRRELSLFVERNARIDFVEVLAEHLDPVRPLPAPLERLRERGLACVLHGVGLSLGGVEPLDPRRLDRLARLAERLGAVCVSEHVSFVRAGGLDSGHLLPLPRTEEALEILCQNVRAAQAVLPVPLALENVAGLFEWPAAQMDEATFLARALTETDALLLLDLANLYANARNHGWDAQAFLDALPLERLAYAHVAGGVEKHGLFHDTHAHPVSAGALELLKALGRRVPSVGVLLERDDRFPSHAELDRELDAISRVRAEPGRAPTSVRTERTALGLEAVQRAQTPLTVSLSNRPGGLDRGFDTLSPSGPSLADPNGMALGLAQVALVRALVSDGEVPSGFDSERVQAAAAALRRKELRAAAKAWPALWRELEAEASSTPGPSIPGRGNGLLTGYLVACERRARGALGDAALLELHAFELRWKVKGGALTPRRGFAFKCWRRPPPSAGPGRASGGHSKGWRIALKTPWGAERFGCFG